MEEHAAGDRLATSLVDVGIDDLARSERVMSVDRRDELVRTDLERWHTPHLGEERRQLRFDGTSVRAETITTPSL